jgi:LysR family nitrogen assimilation transcriptional regulator
MACNIFDYCLLFKSKGDHMGLDLNTLRVVLAVADCASYTRAAQKLGITQPAVSRRIVGLEQQLRTKLFRRDGHRFLPTEAGLAVCDQARQIVGLVDAMPTSVQEIAGQPSGNLALGVPSALGEILLPRLVRSYRDQYPKVFLKIEQGYAGDLSEMLAAKQVDVAILYGKPVTPAIELTPLIDQELGLVYPKAWKKMGPHGKPMPEEMALAETVSFPLIAPGVPQGMRLVIDEAFQVAGVKPRIEMEVNGLSMSKTLVRAGLGCMFLAISGLRGRADRADFAFARIRDPVIRWTLSMAVRRQGQPTLAARLLMRMIQGMVVDLVHDGEWHGKVLVKRP